MKAIVSWAASYRTAGANEKLSVSDPHTDPSLVGEVPVESLYMIPRRVGKVSYSKREN